MSAHHAPEDLPHTLNEPGIRFGALNKINRARLCATDGDAHVFVDFLNRAYGLNRTDVPFKGGATVAKELAGKNAKSARFDRHRRVFFDPLFLLFYVRFFGGHGWSLSALLASITLVDTFFFFEGLLRISLPKGATEPLNLALVVTGVALGLFIGAMPGLGSVNGVAILLPMTFLVLRTGAVIFLAAICYGAMYGGAISSIMLGLPGSPTTAILLGGMVIWGLEPEPAAVLASKGVRVGSYSKPVRCEFLRTATQGFAYIAVRVGLENAVHDSRTDDFYSVRGCRLCAHAKPARRVVDVLFWGGRAADAQARLPDGASGISHNAGSACRGLHATVVDHRPWLVRDHVRKAYIQFHHDRRRAAVFSTHLQDGPQTSLGTLTIGQQNPRVDVITPPRYRQLPRT